MKTRTVRTRPPVGRARRVPDGFEGTEEIERVYDEIDLHRAIDAYRFFYPTVSAAAIFEGNGEVGLRPNKVFGTLDTQPRHVGFTLNSDTPYAPILLDLKDGPMVIDLPPGPLIAVAMDLNQRWVADMGLAGPDGGNGGKHLLVPPDYREKAPAEHFCARSTTNRVLVGVRSLPLRGDVQRAIDRMLMIGVCPLTPTPDWTEPRWLKLTEPPQDTTPNAWENNLQYWEVLHEVVDSEPLYEGYRQAYGQLAALGIEKGKPFAPNAHMKRILEQAARIGNSQMRVESFADRRPDRVVWPDRQWEWAALRFEDGNFNANGFADVVARDKWFFQAIGSSPAMFRRSAGSGSLYWLAVRDSAGEYLDGGRRYTLTVPLPVPARLFWSVTVYDARTRSQIATTQGKAALRSLFEVKDAPGPAIDLHFGPAPSGRGGDGRWIRTIPDVGWFAYFRLYGPEPAAFDGTWRLGDFDEAK